MLRWKAVLLLIPSENLANEAWYAPPAAPTTSSTCVHISAELCMAICDDVAQYDAQCEVGGTVYEYMHSLSEKDRTLSSFWRWFQAIGRKQQRAL